MLNLTKYITHAADNIKLNYRFNKDSLSDYLMKYKLREYFKSDIPEEEKEKLKGSLEEKIEKSFSKYETELRGIARKTTTKGTMGLAILNDLYAYTSKVPFANVSSLGLALFGLKSIIEIPAIERYLKKTHDWYGIKDVATHYALKPIRYLLPVVGPALEAGAFERMVKKRVQKEVVAEFIKENGDYQTLEQRLKEKLKTPVKEVLKKAA